VPCSESCRLYDVYCKCEFIDKLPKDLFTDEVSYKIYQPLKPWRSMRLWPQGAAATNLENIQRTFCCCSVRVRACVRAIVHCMRMLAFLCVCGYQSYACE